ncbi:MAG: terpene cyclase/mutase family protein [Planctomycetota bacterium]
MLRITLRLSVLLAASGVVFPEALAQDWWEHPAEPIEAPEPGQVDGAIGLGLEWLVRSQQADGSWGGRPADPLGQTAYVCRALVASGRGASDETVAKALGYLAQEPLHRVFACGALLTLYEALPEDAREPLEKRAAEAVDLLSDRRREDGLFGFPDSGPDLWNTHWAILGLRSAKRLGIAVPVTAFSVVADTLVRNQHASGGFGDRPSEPVRSSRTLAALTILHVAREVAEESDSFERLREPVTRAMTRATDWLRQHFTVLYEVRGARGSVTKLQLGQMIAGLERYGSLTGAEEIAGHDWFREGAAFLLLNQRPDGSFGDITATAQALHFLMRSSGGPVDRRPLTPEAHQRSLDLQQQARDDRPHLSASIPFVTEWLVAGPWRLEGDVDPFDLERFPLPTEDPRPGEPVAGREWKPYRSPAGSSLVDLERALNPVDWAVAFAAVTLEVPDEAEALLWLGADDGWRVILNGEIVESLDWTGRAVPDRHRVPLKLQRGANTLLLQVSETVGDWGFHARVSDARGNPIRGLRVRTEPPGK